MSRTRFVVAIDGPAGSGKSTVAQRVAERLGYTLVDTGAIYRCLALAAGRGGVALDDEAALSGLAGGLRIEFVPGPRGQRVSLAGEDVSAAIREPAISQAASRVSALPAVRAALLGLQRALGRDGGVVLEGRDIGTVVFPAAEVKVFLQAAPEVRARRRHQELLERGLPSDFDHTLAEVVQRDRRDEGRAVAPLRPAADAVCIDTGGLTLEQVVERVLSLVSERLSALGGRRS